MITATLFNGKGGVGKTLMTMMFVSWLYYGLRKKVFVFDLENPVPRFYQCRERELARARHPESWIARYLAAHPDLPPMYPIGLDSATPEYTNNYLARTIDAMWGFVEANENNYDYFFVDFPAVMMKNSPSYAILSSGLIDFVGIPMNVDQDSFDEGMRVMEAAKGSAKEIVFFWNRLTREEAKSTTLLKGREEQIRKSGFSVLPQRVLTFAKAGRESDSSLFVKSTLCWPRRYVELFSPSVLPLFHELKSRMDALDEKII